MSPNEGVTEIVMEILETSYVVTSPAESKWERTHLCAKHAGCGCVPRAKGSTIAGEEYMVPANAVVPPMTVMIVPEDEAGTRGRHLRTPLEHANDRKREERRRMANGLPSGRGDPKKLEGSPHRRRVIPTHWSSCVLNQACPGARLNAGAE